MNWKLWILFCCLSAVHPLAAEAQASAPKEASQSSDKVQGVAVPAQVAALVRPILDEKQKGAQHDESRLSKLLYGLTQKQGHTADEALVVLMCFDVGESQEETDAVIGRGKRMLPLLKKYQDKNPKIAGRTYPDSMLKGSSSKADTFEGAVKAINHGWHSTADNPEG
jgi:hypothetical protein